MNKLRISQNGTAQLVLHEGKKPVGYICPAGKPTIGIGHLILKGEPYRVGGRISEEEIMRLFDKDNDIAENAVNSLVKVQLNQNQFDALVSFVFNLGKGALASSTLLKLLNAGNYQAAADQLLRWNKGKVKGRLQVIDGLTKRREAERKLFLS